MFSKLIKEVIFGFIKRLFGFGKGVQTEKDLTKTKLNLKQKETEIAVTKGKEKRRQGLRTKVQKAQDMFKSAGGMIVFILLLSGCAAVVVECPVPEQYILDWPQCENITDFDIDNGVYCIVDCSDESFDVAPIWNEEKAVTIELYMAAGRYGSCKELEALGYQEESKQRRDALKGLKGGSADE